MVGRGSLLLEEPGKNQRLAGSSFRAHADVAIRPAPHSILVRFEFLWIIKAKGADEAIAVVEGVGLDYPQTLLRESFGPLLARARAGTPTDRYGKLHGNLQIDGLVFASAGATGFVHEGDDEGDTHHHRQNDSYSNE